MLDWERQEKWVARCDGAEYVVLSDEEPGEWVVQIDGSIHESGLSLQEAKGYCERTAAALAQEAEQP